MWGRKFHASFDFFSWGLYVSRPAPVVSLGFDPVGSATKTSHLGLKQLPSRLHSCYRLGRSCSFVCRLRPGSPLSILRSSPSSNICMGCAAFYCWNRFLNRRRLPSEFTALARSRLRGLHACVLCNDGVGRVKLKQAES